MTREEAIKSALKYLVHKQQEQGSWGYADNDNINKVPWDEALEWIDQQPCGDLISRQAVLETQAKYVEHMGATKFWQMRDDIRALPPVTPQPEVIWCKDCKHWTNNIGDSELRDNYCNEEAHGFYYRCSGDDYCSFAERRTDE